jgi:hypothetical protein
MQMVMMREGSDWLNSYYRKIYSADSSGLQQNGQSIRELAAICRSRNIKLLLVNIPDLRRLENYPFSYATDFIRGIAAESRLPFLDLLPEFDKITGNSLWVSGEDSHMNGRANGLAADAIFKKMIREKMVD